MKDSSLIMELLIAILITAFQNLEAVLGDDTCPVVRYTGKFNESDHVKDHALTGRSYKNLTTNTVQECFSVCINDCRCVSYQLSGRRCELIDEDRHTAPDLFKRLSGYKYYELKQQFKKSNSVGCSSQCNNGCCRYSKPCLNGGTCIETCQNVTHKFLCKCPQGFGGRVCQTPPSCAAYSHMSVPNIYPIQTTNGKVLKVYCDMTSEPGMVWTLIESFVSLSGKPQDRKALYKDFPSNEGNFTWSDYRLSHNAMQHVKRDATHWRATCKYDTDGLNKTDYIRGRLSEMDILTFAGEFVCARVEYINVRGISCENCTAVLKQLANRHIFVDSAKGFYIGCDWDGREGAIRKTAQNYCNNFGFYDTQYNPAHRCTASQSSTTQWWLGTKN
ncbi:uncharacterized protein LOC116294844 [Actinia tenebrosa]|uniref:Uncharacterized protein LOC116294844 n=1 Tax=Actinia tenebrosa TaxID=6105 RepID=A0A6P8I0H3_ACTTE|nr:uncharacterized protein LOC116294844 [Actinia tenebrosa]